MTTKPYYPLAVPYTNTLVWKPCRYSHRGYTSTEKLHEWLLERNLWESGFWYDSTQLSDGPQGVLLFGKVSHLFIFASNFEVV